MKSNLISISVLLTAVLWTLCEGKGNAPQTQRQESGIKQGNQARVQQAAWNQGLAAASAGAEAHAAASVNAAWRKEGEKMMRGGQQQRGWAPSPGYIPGMPPPPPGYIPPPPPPGFVPEGQLGWMPPPPQGVPLSSQGMPPPGFVPGIAQPGFPQPGFPPQPGFIPQPGFVPQPNQQPFCPPGCQPIAGFAGGILEGGSTNMQTSHQESSSTQASGGTWTVGGSNVINGRQQIIDEGQQVIRGAQHLIGSDQQVIAGAQQIIGSGQQVVDGAQNVISGSQPIVDTTHVQGGEQKTIEGSQSVYGNEQTVVGDGVQNIVGSATGQNTTTQRGAGISSGGVAINDSKHDFTHGSSGATYHSGGGMISGGTSVDSFSRGESWRESENITSSKTGQQAGSWNQQTAGIIVGHQNEMLNKGLQGQISGQQQSGTMSNLGSWYAGEGSSSSQAHTMGQGSVASGSKSQSGSWSAGVGGGQNIISGLDSRTRTAGQIGIASGSETQSGSWTGGTGSVQNIVSGSAISSSSQSQIVGQGAVISGSQSESGSWTGGRTNIQGSQSGSSSQIYDKGQSVISGSESQSGSWLSGGQSGNLGLQSSSSSHISTGGGNVTSGSESQSGSWTSGGHIGSQSSSSSQMQIGGQNIISGAQQIISGRGQQTVTRNQQVYGKGQQIIGGDRHSIDGVHNISTSGQQIIGSGQQVIGGRHRIISGAQQVIDSGQNIISVEHNVVSSKQQTHVDSRAGTSLQSGLLSTDNNTVFGAESSSTMIHSGVDGILSGTESSARVGTWAGDQRVVGGVHHIITGGQNVAGGTITTQKGAGDKSTATGVESQSASQTNEGIAVSSSASSSSSQITGQQGATTVNQGWNQGWNQGISSQPFGGGNAVSSSTSSSSSQITGQQGSTQVNQGWNQGSGRQPLGGAWNMQQTGGWNKGGDMQQRGGWNREWSQQSGSSTHQESSWTSGSSSIIGDMTIGGQQNVPQSQSSSWSNNGIWQWSHHINSAIFNEPTATGGWIWSNHIKNHQTMPVPYVSQIGTTLQEGSELVVHAVPKTQSDRLYVLLWSGALNQMYEIPVLVNVDFSQGKLSVKTLRYGLWSNQADVNLQQQITQDFFFHLRIFSDRFEIVINDQILVTVKEPLDYLRPSKYFAVGGDVMIKKLYWTRKPTDKFRKAFPGGTLPVGQSILVYGIPRKDDFTFDFTSKNEKDIMFHFRHRDNAIIRNTRRNGVWGQQEMTAASPFQRDIPCVIVFHRSQQFMEVYVNGQLHCKYSHRLQNGEDYASVVRWGGFDILGFEMPTAIDFNESAKFDFEL